MQVGRRMAIVRLRSGELLVHSPAELTRELRGALEGVGTVRFVVPASNLHGHLFMQQYRDAYPDAELFAAPGLHRRRKDLEFAGELGDTPDSRWGEDLDQALFRGHHQFIEVVFLHRANRTLLLGDLCWNVTAEMSPGARLWAGWRTRVTPTPAFKVGIRDRAAARASLERILEWDFDRILVGHGEIVERGGREAFRGAYAWLLEDPGRRAVGAPR
jgi:hypothetical protein